MGPVCGKIRKNNMEHDKLLGTPMTQENRRSPKYNPMISHDYPMIIPWFIAHQYITVLHPQGISQGLPLSRGLGDAKHHVQRLEEASETLAAAGGLRPQSVVMGIIEGDQIIGFYSTGNGRILGESWDNSGIIASGQQFANWKMDENGWTWPFL